MFACFLDSDGFCDLHFEAAPRFRKNSHIEYVFLVEIVDERPRRVGEFPLARHLPIEMLRARILPIQAEVEGVVGFFVDRGDFDFESQGWLGTRQLDLIEAFCLLDCVDLGRLLAYQDLVVSVFSRTNQLRQPEVLHFDLSFSLVDLVSGFRLLNIFFLFICFLQII